MPTPTPGAPAAITEPVEPAPQPIELVAQRLGLGTTDFEPVGWYKAKLSFGLQRRRVDRPPARYIVVTAINPTPLGEGKTITAIGLAMGLAQVEQRSLVTLREPSLGPLFGIKGGGAGGGRAYLLPRDDINLHFTGDLHAVTAATNLLAALVDNHVLRGQSPRIEPASISWRRALDICDRSLEQVTTRAVLGEHQLQRATGFDLTPASEIMAILALATSIDDLRHRLGRIVVGQTPAGEWVTAEELRAAGALAALLRDAVRPNLVQTSEHTAALVHTGPFGNIAHGNSSVIADLAAVRCADYVVTESGFGSECGAEKFFNIKCRTSGLVADAAVLVCTVRALKLHSGRTRVRPGKPLPPELLAEDLDALRSGAENLDAHLDILRQFGIPTVVAINRFPTDSDRELAELERLALRGGAARVAVSEPFSRGGAGAESLARAVIEQCAQPNQFRYLYPLEMPPVEKIETIATRLYGAAEVEFSPRAREQLAHLQRTGFGDLPVCIAKTQYSLSHDPQLLGRPRGFCFPIHEVRLSAGAGFLYALAGEIRTMPGLPSQPAACDVDITSDGRILGLR